MRDETGTVKDSDVVGVSGQKKAKMPNDWYLFLQYLADLLMAPKVMLDPAQRPCRYRGLKLCTLFDF